MTKVDFKPKTFGLVYNINLYISANKTIAFPKVKNFYGAKSNMRFLSNLCIILLHLAGTHTQTHKPLGFEFEYLVLIFILRHA